MDSSIFYINLIEVQTSWFLEKRELHSFCELAGISSSAHLKKKQETCIPISKGGLNCCGNTYKYSTIQVNTTVCTSLTTILYPHHHWSLRIGVKGEKWHKLINIFHGADAVFSKPLPTCTGNGGFSYFAWLHLGQMYYNPSVFE